MKFIIIFIIIIFFFCLTSLQERNYNKVGEIEATLIFVDKSDFKDSIAWVYFMFHELKLSLYEEIEWVEEHEVRGDDIMSQLLQVETVAASLEADMFFVKLSLDIDSLNSYVGFYLWKWRISNRHCTVHAHISAIRSESWGIWGLLWGNMMLALH